MVRAYRRQSLDQGALKAAREWLTARAEAPRSRARGGECCEGDAANNHHARGTDWSARISGGRQACTAQLRQTTSRTLLSLLLRTGLRRARGGSRNACGRRWHTVRSRYVAYRTRDDL